MEKPGNPPSYPVQEAGSVPVQPYQQGVPMEQYHQPQQFQAQPGFAPQGQPAQYQQPQYTGDHMNPHSNMQSPAQGAPMVGTPMSGPQQHMSPPPIGAAQGNSQQFLSATPLQNLNRSPAPVDCKNCGVRAMTRITPEVGNTNHAWAGGLFVSGICFLVPCLFCWVPYLITDFKNIHHRCSNCGCSLATWHRSGTVDVHQH